MKKYWMGILLAVATLPATGALAQTTEPPFPVTLEKQLAARATNYTEVSLDRKMLAFASHFMDKEDDEEGKRIVAKLNGVYVRTYEFDKPGQYTAADLEAIRRQFQTPEWTSLVKSRSKNGEDDSDIYIKMVGTEAQGMFILNAEPNELNFVYLDGPINPDELSDLSGNFGIPKDAGKPVKEASK
jgi:hypothetical protein